MDEQGAGVEYAKELVARSIAPIKSEYLKPRDVQQEEVGCKEQENSAEEPKGTKGGKQSKREQRKQRRKELKKNANAQGNFCTRFLSQGHCSNLDKCIFSHDTEKFLEQKPKDLRGHCPFLWSKEACRFGIMCRWSSSHDVTDNKVKVTEEGCENPINIEHDSQRATGSIPENIVLPVSKNVEEPLNSLSKDLQVKLRKQKYDFSKVDDILRNLGIKISRPQKQATMVTAGADSEKEDGRNVPVTKKQCVELSDGSIAAIGSAADVSLRKEEKAKVDFRGKLYLSPLTTLGNLPFRRVCVGFGTDVTCGEMALATNILQGNPSEWALLKRHPCEKIFGVQVCGGFSDSLSRCAALVEEGLSVDFVDVNMGCPIDTICDRSAGSALLKKVNKIEEILKGMSRVLSCPLTIKIRKGYEDNNDVAHKFLPRIGSLGACAVTLHGRSRQQRYTRTADWDYIHKCADLAPDIQLIGNGDIFSPHDWVQHVEGTNVATCMIGRGALIKPWIFTEIKENRLWDISAGERLDILKNFCSFGLEHWGSDSRGVENTRRFLLEWLSFLHRYVPVGILEVVPQHIQWRPQAYYGRNDLETLLASDKCSDWIQISEMLLGPPPESFSFTPKHVSNAYVTDKNNTSKRSVDGEQENG